MKGIVLAGDSCLKLHPLTIGIPKQLLPLYDKPMIYYPIQTLLSAGIKDIMIITTTEQQSMFRKYLGDGSFFNATFIYAYQDTPKGIADALTIGKDYVDKEGVCLITGDTILIGQDVLRLITKASKALKNSGSATIFVKRDSDANQYGKVLLNKNGKCETIVGSSSRHNYSSITGLYVFPQNAINMEAIIDLSERGLLEITSLNK